MRSFEFAAVAAWGMQLVLWIDIVASFSTKTPPAPKASSLPLPKVPRIPASEFDPNLQYYHTIQDENGNLWAYETPVIVEGVLSEEACEKLTDDLVENCGSIEVTLQRKRRESILVPESLPPKPSKGKQRRKQRERRPKKSKTNDSKAGGEATAAADAGTTTDLYLCSFLEAIDLVLGQSKHDDALLAFCEGLLNSPMDTAGGSSSLRSLQQTMEDLREDLFQQGSTTSPPMDPCWFREYFPKDATPTDCVILAGEGATSTLHRDPLEWTGTNICLDGTKVWRFVAPPLAAEALARVNQQEGFSSEVFGDVDPKEAHCSSVEVIDRLLDAYRLDSIAWGGGNDSDNNSDDNSDNDPLILSAGWQSDYSLFANFCDGITSSDLSKMEKEEGTEEKLDCISTIASNVDRLQPDIPVGIIGRTSSSTKRQDLERENCDITIWSGVQKPGDMIVIPAHWWHQTYAMEASLAIASQRCGAQRDSDRVLRHILETTMTAAASEEGENPANILSSLRLSSSSSPQETVDRLFDHLASLQKERRQVPSQS